MFPKLPKILTIIFLLFIIIHTLGFLFLNLFYLPAQAIGIGQPCDPANDQCDSPLECDADFKLCSMVVESTRLNDSMPLWENPFDTLQVKIPGMEKFTEAKACPSPNQDKMCVPWIGQYIAGIYKYAIGIVGILAAVVLMIGGIVWLTAGGSATRVGEAKAWIGASLTGLIIALTSYMILYQINPKLTQFKPIEVAVVEKAPETATSTPSGCCTAYDNAMQSYFGCVADITKTECEDKSERAGRDGFPTPLSIGYAMTFVVSGKCTPSNAPNYNPCEIIELGCCLYNFDDPSSKYKDCENNITYDDCQKKSGLIRSWDKEQTCKHLDWWPYNDWECE